MFHLLAAPKPQGDAVSYETDRARFIGRGRSTADPQALDSNTPLSGSAGSVLDPIVAIRCRIHLDPGESAAINLISGVSSTRAACNALVRKYRQRRVADLVLSSAATHAQAVLGGLHVSVEDAQLYTELAASVLYANASLRADPSVLASNHQGQSGLWGYAISGDLPIVLLRCAAAANPGLARQLVQAHSYWRLKGLVVDLVIWNEDHAGYRQQLQEQIMGLIAAGVGTHVTDQPGGIFVRPADQISNEERTLLQTVARVIVTDSRGMLADQVNRRNLGEITVPLFTPTRSDRAAPPAVAALPRHDLLFFTGLGGFTPDGREYIITTTPDQVTPT